MASTGVPGQTAVDLARSLLADFGSLRALLAADLRTFSRHKGLGSAKYAQLQAVLEMARRHLLAQLSSPEALNSPSAAGDYLRARIGHLPHEVFAVLFLDSQHRLLAVEELARGTVDGAAVYPREVVKAALRHNAAAVLLAHNHPSGVAEPSTADRALTERLREALKLVDIRVLDHLIVCTDRITSFAERGWI